MSRSIGLAQIIRHEDGICTGAWGHYTLKSAFQPIFAFDKGRVTAVAFEGLIRPFREEEPVSPPAFFASVPPIERLTIETVTRTLHLLNAVTCLPPEASVFVNFDPSVFTDRSVAEQALRDMRQVLHEVGIDPRRVVCEVTEQKSGSQEALFGFVAALKANAFRIAVDDYGAEDSDMGRITDLKPDIVKFDAKWISRLMESGPGYALLTEMVSSFSAQSIRTVFEGIEESWQLELAERSGASMVQGYALARPVLASRDFPDFNGAQQQAPTGAAESSAAGSAPRPASGPRTGRNFGRRHLR